MQVNTCARGCTAAASVNGDDRDPAKQYSVYRSLLVPCNPVAGPSRLGSFGGNTVEFLMYADKGCNRS